MKTLWNALVTAILLSLAFAGSHSPTATIDAGVVVGTTTSLTSASTAVNQFFGVPFAAPPKRFSPPQDAQPWSNPLNTTVRKGACIQQFNYPELSRNFTQALFNTPPPEESEDCLYLNVFAPAAPAAGKRRAVLFWIYGGALQFGYGSQPFYDGSHFAAYEDVIVVTPNYRTNAFGFPNSPEIPVAQRNLGFLDQRFALQWVQKNIHAFGGDPSKVTIFGESAGAWSTDVLLTSFPANSTPPFRAAILESGQISYRGNPSPGKPFPDGTPAWYALAAALNCTEGQSNLTCVEAAPASTIKDIVEHQALYFSPTYDNVTFVSDPAKARTSGNIARIPVLSGTNAEEGRVLAIGEKNVTAYLQGILPTASADLLGAIEAAYPVGGWEFPTPYDAISQMETDVSFHCGDALMANDTAAAGIPSWRYYFNASFPNTQQFPNGGVYHSSEILLVFSTYPTVNATATEFALSNFMRGTWARFAKDPEAGPGWNAVGTGGQYLEGAADLDVGVLGGEGWAGVKVVRQSDVDGRCAVWSGVLHGRA